MDFFDRQEASHRATRYLVLLFGGAFIAVGLATGIALLILLGLANSGSTLAYAQPNFVALLLENLDTLLLLVAVVVGLMIIASLFRAATLSQGGGHVARMLGGTQLSGDDPDPAHRRLINVVEEMAIASGLPVPEIYVLETERGINAFAAGLTPADAAIAVTRGSLEQLNRDELQGVIAHEFSHILNGDMRLNLRLMGFSFGILVLTLVGRWLLRASSRGMSFRSRKGGSPAIVIGIVLLVIGGIGVLFSRLIKAAVSRQRETLADASAVQFTREPLALAGALKKIGGFTPHLESIEAEEVSHMLFGRAGRSFIGLFATHPPLDQRISALDPSFKPGDYVTPGAADASRTSTDAVGVSRFSGGGGSITLESAGSIAAAAGSALLGAIPTDVADAAHSTQSAWLLVLALGLERGAGTEAERRLLENRIGPERTARCLALRQQIDALDQGLLLPLFEMTVPALKARPRQELEFLFELLAKLAEADGQLTLFEYLLQRSLQAHFEIARPSRSSQREQRLAATTLLATIAVHGHADESAARAAFAAGLAVLPGVDATAGDARFARALSVSAFDDLDQALSVLTGAPPAEQRGVLTALAVCMRYDGVTDIAEAELFRTVAAVLGCPVPPSHVIS